MAEEQNGLAAALRAVASDARAALSSHLTPEKLLAYHEHELGEAEADAIQEHLALCHECTRLLLDIDAFPALEPPGGQAGLSDAQVEREWALLQRRIAAEGGPPQAPRASRPWHPPRWAYGAAAGWLAATLGLCVWIVRLRERVDALSQPRVNLALGEFSPVDDAVRDVREAWRTLRLEAGQEQALLVLHALDAPAAPPYVAELWRDGRPAWKRSDLRLGAEGMFTLQFSRHALAPGRYRLRLTAAGAAALEYRFVVVHAPEQASGASR